MAIRYDTVSMRDQETGGIRIVFFFFFFFFIGRGTWALVKGIINSHFQEIGYFFKNPVRFGGKFLRKSLFRGQILREKHTKILVSIILA